MGVELDWTIDDTGRRRSPAQPGPSPRRRRIVQLAGAAVLGLALAATLWLGSTWRRVEDELDAGLRHAIALEAEAYVAGDRELFLSLQDNEVIGWLNHQREWFNARQEWPAAQPFAYGLEIVELHRAGELAWVVVDETRPDLEVGAEGGLTAMAPVETRPLATYRRVLFYRRHGARWLHSAPQPVAGFEPRELVRGRYTVSYPAWDEAAVQGWLDVLVPFSERVCADLQCGDEPRWTLVVTTTRWSWDQPAFGPWFSNAEQLLLPSPSVAGYRTGGGLDSRTGPPLLWGAILEPIRVRLGFNPYQWDSRADTPASFSQSLLSLAFVYWELRWAFETMPEGLPPVVRAMLAPGSDELPHDLLAQPEPEADPRFIPLDALGREQPGTGRPGSPDWRVTLLESGALLDYVAARYGRERIGDLLAAAATAPSVGAAVQATFGVGDLPAFQRDWLDHVRAQP
jgi:hypothetical protein